MSDQLGNICASKHSHVELWTYIINANLAKYVFFLKTTKHTTTYATCFAKQIGVNAVLEVAIGRQIAENHELVKKNFRSDNI